MTPANILLSFSDLQRQSENLY